jgi:hypothetical protein
LEALSRKRKKKFPFFGFVFKIPKKAKKGDNLWTVLPGDIIVYILSFLGVGDILSISLVCKSFHQFCKQDSIWKIHCLKIFPGFLPSEKSKSYRELILPRIKKIS